MSDCPHPAGNRSTVCYRGAYSADRGGHVFVQMDTCHRCQHETRHESTEITEPYLGTRISRFLTAFFYQGSGARNPSKRFPVIFHSLPAGVLAATPDRLVWPSGPFYMERPYPDMAALRAAFETTVETLATESRKSAASLEAFAKDLDLIRGGR